MSDIEINAHQEPYEGKLSTEDEGLPSDQQLSDEGGDSDELSDEEQALADLTAAANAAADAAFAASPRAADDLAVLNARDEEVAQAHADKAREDVMARRKPDVMAISNQTGAAKAALDEEAAAGPEEQEAKFVEAEDSEAKDPDEVL